MDKLFEAPFEADLSRRDFLNLSAKMSILAGTSLAFAGGITGCSTLPEYSRPEIDYKKGVVFTNCNIVDSVTGTVTRDGVIFIQGEHIVYSGKKKYFDASQAEVFNMGGRYVMPGLVNSHVHMTLPGSSYFSLFDSLSVLRQMKRGFTLEIESGVTTVRDMAAFWGYLKGYDNDIKKGNLNGPRIVKSTSFINVKGAHPDVNPTDLSMFAAPVIALYGSPSSNYTDYKDLQDKITNDIDRSSYVKLSMDNKSLICGNGKIPVYSEKDLRFIKNFSQKKEKPISCHVMMKYGFDRAMENSPYSLEHIVSDAYLTDSDIKKMSDKKTAVTPTCVIGNVYAMDEAFDKLPDIYQTDFIENEIKVRKEYWKGITEKDCEPFVHKSNVTALKWFKTMSFKELYKNKKFIMNPNFAFGTLIYGKANLLKMRDAGILIGAGTDAGVPFNYHGTLWRELELMSRMGLSNKEILQAATINGAKICRMDESIGSIEKGKYADLVVLDRNPLEDVTAYRNPHLVFKGGKLKVQRNNLEKNKNEIVEVKDKKLST